MKRKRARQQMEKSHRWIRYITLFLFCGLLILISACENVRHSIGVTAKPFSEKFEEGMKVNYKIIFGKVRPKEDDDD